MPAAASELRQELRRLALVGSALLAGLTVCVALLADTEQALRWLLPALACWCFVLWRCRSGLHLNLSLDTEKRFARLGQGNRLTLWRGLLIAFTAGFLAVDRQTALALAYLPALLYTGAAIGDALDGYLARREGQSTKLGRQLDNELDALGLLVAPLLAILFGKLHISYLLVSIAYYFFRWGLYWRHAHDKPVYPLPPSRIRRQLAGWQMALVATSLWPPVSAEVTRLLGILFMLPLLAGFIIDWLHVSGRRGAKAGAET